MGQSGMMDINSRKKSIHTKTHKKTSPTGSVIMAQSGSVLVAQKIYLKNPTQNIIKTETTTVATATIKQAVETLRVRN
jgi:hypothetical protein